MISSSLKYGFDIIIYQVIYLRPQADEGLLAFLYGKRSSKKNPILVSPLLTLQCKYSLNEWILNDKNIKK